jgi:hypothetical protein
MPVGKGVRISLTSPATANPFDFQRVMRFSTRYLSATRISFAALPVLLPPTLISNFPITFRDVIFMPLIVINLIQTTKK